MARQDLNQDIFRRLKSACVPLLGASLLTSTSIPDVFKYLGELNTILLDVRASGTLLTPDLISYTFFPLSTLLRRNAASDIPDQILEKVFIALSILCEDWWWDCDVAIWEQLFMLCGAVVAGIDGKDTGRARDDETKAAAGECLLALLHVQTHKSTSSNKATLSNRTQARLEVLKTLTRTDKFLPILGRTLDSLLVTLNTPHFPLQRVSLRVLSLIIGVYAPDGLVPSILPGVVSQIIRIALGTSTNKGWANGEIVSGCLEVMQLVIVRALGNDVCAKEGAIHPVVDLDDLSHAIMARPDLSFPESRPFSTSRTSSWLRGTSSQLLMALNTLTPLVNHPTPSALLAVSKISTSLLSATSMTLPEVQPLLLHWLLSLSNSDFSSVSNESRESLSSLLMTPSEAQLPLQQSLLHIIDENLLALPRLLSTHADAKVEHVAGIVEAVCRLVPSPGEQKAEASFILNGVGKLLGPSGGIEKWGWSLLSVLELSKPPITLTTASSARLMLESNTDTIQWESFPEIDFKNVSSTTTRHALERMFRALGRASGDNCLFSIEWFANVGRSGTGSRSTTAMWCACRLLEGVAEISLSHGGETDGIPARRSKRLTRLTRSLVRSIAELWDEPDETKPTESIPKEEDDLTRETLVQHVKGTYTLPENLRITRRAPAKQSTVKQPGLHRSLSLQLLAVSAGILQAQFTSLLLYTLYPILRSLVSPDVCLSSTALATLNYIAAITSYASPANLLLSNFDYALDSISRRLSRRWLDVEATKVLSLMIRLVGSDIVERAGDIVEECFDRLDEFHGYSIIVEGLVEVLEEVVNVVNQDKRDDTPVSIDPPDEAEVRVTSMDDFFSWLQRRHQLSIEEADTTDYGPAPREAWGAKRMPDPDPADETADVNDPDPNVDPPLTPIQALVKQIVSRSLYFLTHNSPIIRAKILSLLASSVSVLSESTLLPSIHSAWPFVLNRLSDSEAFVVSSAAYLVESLATRFGSFMFRRIWEDVWPRFRVLLSHMDTADTTSALSRRGVGAVGTESAYTHSHRTYRSVIKTMTAAVTALHLQETSTWQLLLVFRRFLHREAHEELQQCARDLYLAVGKKEADTVWLALSSTMDNTHITMQFLATPRWDIRSNANIVFQNL